MGIGPYQARPYDNSRSTARMSDLAERLGDVQAEGHLRSGQAWAQGVQQVGQIASRTMMDLADYKEQAPIREAELQKAKDYTAASKRRGTFNELQRMTGGMDQDDAIDFFRREGFGEEAGEMAKQLAETRKRQIDTSIANMTLTDKYLDRGMTMLGAVQSAPDPAAAYAASLPDLRKMVGPNLGKNLPDTYDPAFIAKAQEWGLSTKERLDVQREALRSAELTGKSKQDRDEYFTKALGTVLGKTNTQEDWTNQIEAAAFLGAPKETIGKFGDQYTPDAAAKAAALITPPRAEGKPSLEESFVDAYARGKGVDPSKLTDSQLLDAHRKWAESSRRPAASNGLTNLTKVSTADVQRLSREIQADYDAMLDPEDDGEPVSISQKGAAIRWRASAMRQLDSLARKSGINPGSLADLGKTETPNLGAITASEGRASYESRPAPSAVAPRAPSGPPPRPMSSHGAPSAQIAAALKAEGPGEYDMVDGSTWRVLPNGTIEKVK